MRTKWFSPVLVVLAAVALSGPATAQTIAYTNFLQFDLQSYRSQATGGMFDDDIENVADAAKLMNIEGNRLFTSFSNLADPAGFGDNILSYSVDHVGVPTATDHFDTGSYLLGWIGKYDPDSEYNFSVFYQRNSARGMFEDLDGGGLLDAEANGSFTTTTTTSAAPYDVTSISTSTFDLMRYSTRSATDFDLGAAKDMSEDMSVGARLFFEKDQLDFFSSGTVGSNFMTDHDADPATALRETSRSRTEYIGNGEDAYQFRTMGVSLNTDYHSWDNQSVGIRVDIFGRKETNPGLLSATPSTFGLEAPWLEGVRVNLGTDTSYGFLYQDTGTTGVGASPLLADQMNTTTSTFNYNNISFDKAAARGGIATESIDDERSGLGFDVKGEYNREWAGGEINSWAGFGTVSQDIASTQVMVDRYEQHRWWNNGTSDLDAVLMRATTNTITRDGDAKWTTLEAGGRWNRDLNQHVSLGLGGVVTRSTGKDDYRAVTQANFDESRDDGDPGANVLFGVNPNPDYNEGTITRRRTDTNDVTDETKVTSLRFPVGAQFHFRDRWTFNMGAQHIQSNVTREMVVAQPAGLNGITETTTVDATGTSTVSRSTSEFTGSTTVTHKDRTNRTTYWYGVSVDITDAVQLDVNGFLDTNSGDHTTDDAGRPTGELTGGGTFGDIAFWRNLAVSLKFIFW
ncbi:MAG: hypothetical protein DHS20C21_00770 [Gemmatimonadota bacterium]|nr:MAG: hypothetical protein DHS20C21_00770 [Gemmatimonadota bacterium]